MLSDFYKSDKWIKLVHVLRLERLNADGELICEYCGKPITHKYDCIGHHKTELTEENYERAEISLNPENIALVHHRCHNKIHDRLGLSYTKQVFLVYGSPLSGKTTWVKDNMNAGDLVIDMDSIWKCISGQPQYIKPKRLTSTAFMVRNCLIDSVKVRNGNWLNAYVIGGYPLISERERLIKSLGAREIFIDTSKEECLNRLAHDSSRTKDYEKYIEDWFDKYSK
jgi:hypothetical protein